MKENKKPPAAPPRKPKKKVFRPPTPEPPKEDPPEEPLTHSPIRLQIPVEAGIPNQEGEPTHNELPMRLPQEPPAEPPMYIMANIYCPVDPDTPYNYEIEPRDEEFPIEPLEPLPLRQAIEPDDPPYPEKMIKSSTKEIINEKSEEPEMIQKPQEPAHDDEPALPYPKMARQPWIPTTMPEAKEPDSIE